MPAGRLILRIISSHCLLYHNENGSVYKTNCHATAIKYSSSRGDVRHVSRKEHPIHRKPSLCLLSTLREISLMYQFDREEISLSLNSIPK